MADVTGVSATFSLATSAGVLKRAVSGIPATFALGGNSGSPYIPVVVPVSIPFAPVYYAPSYYFVLCDPFSGVDIDELIDATGRSVSLKLRAPSEAKFGLALNSSQAKLISPLGTGLKVYRNESLVFRGLVGPTSGTKGAGNIETIEYTASDYRGLLKRYILWAEDAAVTQGYITDGEEVGWNFIDTVQKRGYSLGIIRGDNGPVGEIATYRAEANDTVLSALQKVADSGKTFDWDITDVGGRMTYEAWPSRGVDTSYSLDYKGDMVEASGYTLDPGGSMLSMNYTYNPEQFANVIRVQGAGSLIATAYSASLESSPVGRYEMAVSDDSLKTQAAVEARAEGLLKLHEDLIPTYSVKLASEKWTPEELWLGDALIVDYLPGRKDKVRVTEIGLEVNEGESVSVTLGKVLPNVFMRAAEAYERAGNAQASVMQKAKAFIQDTEPMNAGISDFWTPSTPGA